MLLTANGVARFPEFRRDALVGWVLHHVDFFAFSDFPTDFAPELEVQSPLVDTPQFVGFHEHTIIGIGNQIVFFPITGFKIQISDADNRDVVPSVSAVVS